MRRKVLKAKYTALNFFSCLLPLKFYSLNLLSLNPCQHGSDRRVTSQHQAGWEPRVPAGWTLGLPGAAPCTSSLPRAHLRSPALPSPGLQASRPQGCTVSVVGENLFVVTGKMVKRCRSHPPWQAPGQDSGPKQRPMAKAVRGRGGPLAFGEEGSSRGQRCRAATTWVQWPHWASQENVHLGGKKLSSEHVFLARFPKEMKSLSLLVYPSVPVNLWICWRLESEFDEASEVWTSDF